MFSFFNRQKKKKSKIVNMEELICGVEFKKPMPKLKSFMNRDLIFSCVK